MQRSDLINEYIKRYNFKSFLEIGTYKGDTFKNISCEIKESVDPDISCNATYQTTSDEFFRIVNKKYDIIFIDGLHISEQVDRDILNSLNHLNNNGVIIMHDCHPWSEEVQIHDACNHPIVWTGDCWKAFVKNRATLPYEMYVWDHDCGCGVIDTNIRKISDTSRLPTNMEKLTYQDFIMHPEWMNFKNEIMC